MTNEHESRCECGHLRWHHDSEFTESSSCLIPDCPCVEYEWDRACSHCGNVHDQDISADIAEDYLK